jgi:hypothetical protein
MSENVIRKYIQNQKVNVKSSYKYKSMLVQKTDTHRPKSNTINTITPKATNTIEKDLPGAGNNASRGGSAGLSNSNQLYTRNPNVPKNPN